MNIQKTLLMREFWEHKGGFLWAPLVAAALFLIIALGGMITGSVMAHKAGQSGDIVVHGQHMNSMQLGQVLSNMPAHEVAQVGKAIDMSLWVAAAWPFMVVAFVVFFYCISALYDERKDRSVLFWKSMPVSDNATVLSKALSALVLVPAIAAVTGAASMLIFYLFMSLWVSFHGGNAFTLLGATRPLSVLVQLVGALPIYALWALPTAGWLLLCSAFARSKPFLWAILVPVMLGVAASMLDMGDGGWVWHHVVQRALLGFVPGAWLGEVGSSGSAFALGSTYSVLASPSLWIGAVLGAGMLFGAAHVRRWKDEG